MSLLFAARNAFGRLLRLPHRLLRPSKVVPLTFADMERRKRELFGADVDRSPCSCPSCRHQRGKGRPDAAA